MSQILAISNSSHFHRRSMTTAELSFRRNPLRPMFGSRSEPRYSNASNGRKDSLFGSGQLTGDGQEPSTEAQKVMFENDKVGYKAPTQMLAMKKMKRSTVWQQIGAQVQFASNRPDLCLPAQSCRSRTRPRRRRRSCLRTTR